MHSVTLSWGKEIIKINRWYPSSKTCCECGWINQDLNLSVREWTCKNGHVLDRDLNAAKNILKEDKKEEKPVVDYYQNGKPNLEVCSETNNPWYSSIFQPFAICYNKRQFAAINKLLPSKDGKKNFVISSLRGLDMDRSEHTLPTTEHFLGLVVPEKVNNVVVMDRNDFIDKSLAKAVTDLKEVREVKSENEFLTSINRFRMFCCLARYYS